MPNAHRSAVFSIPVINKLDFYEALTAYYDDDSNLVDLKEFLINKCLTVYSIAKEEAPDKEVDSEIDI